MVNFQWFGLFLMMRSSSSLERTNRGVDCAQVRTTSVLGGSLLLEGFLDRQFHYPDP